MAHKPFNLYRRPTRNGKCIYYVQFYDDTGKRLTAKSTGQTSKAAAESWAYEQLKNGHIITKKNITFGQYARDWWVWGHCLYIKSRLARGANISRGYVDSMRTYLEQHILPSFGNSRLQKITPDMIMQWLMDLKEKPGKNGQVLSATTVNHCLRTLKIMLKEAERRGYLSTNPSHLISALRKKPKEKPILTQEEVKELFQEDRIDEIWTGDLRHYTLNLLAASTGMRMGEVQSLQNRDFHQTYIAVEHSWDRKYGLKEPKWGSQRMVPIPSKTSAYLLKLIDMAPFNDSDDFMFFGSTRNLPLSNETILRTLYKAFEKIGITSENRRERNITFHSWRHFYNSMMRGKVHDSKLRRLTGHRTVEMTEHYTHFQLEDFVDVMEIQEQYFSKNTNH